MTAGTVAEAPATASAHGHRLRSSRLLVAAVAILTVAPVVAAGVSVIGRHWFASGDQALELLRIRDVGTSHTPLVGAWSRWGWAHPGPALFYALAPFERLFGATGVLVGMATINGLAIAGAVVVAARRGGVTLAALAGFMAVLLVRALGLARVVDPWNPWAAFFPFVLFLLLAWSVLCRDRALLAWAVLVGSYTVQAHAGYLPFVGPLLALALAFAVVDVTRNRALRQRERRTAGRWLAVALVLGFVVWLPPLVQQVFGDHGNASAMVSYLRDTGEPSAGWELAWGTFGNELRPVAPWVGGNDDNGLGLTDVAAVWPAAAFCAALVAVALFAWRRRKWDAVRLIVVAGIVVPLAVLSASKLTGGFFVYATRWWWAVAALANLAVVWGLVQVVDRARLRTVVTAVAVAGIVVAGVMTVGDLPATLPEAELSTPVRVLSEQTAGALDHGTRYVVHDFDFAQLDAVSRGVYVELARRGFQVYEEPAALAHLQFGSWRLATAAQADAVVEIADVAEPSFTPAPDSRLVASFDPLSPPERARERQLEDDIRAQLGPRAPDGRILVNTGYLRFVLESAGAPHDAVAELATLQARGDGFAVYVRPA